MKKIFLLFIISLSFLACKKEDQIGPDIEGIGGPPLPISDFTVSRDSVAFRDGQTIHFNMNFEKSTYWRLTISGQGTGATKVIESVSKTINETNSKWDGQTNSFPNFTREECIVTLTFPNYPESESYSATFVIKNIEQADVKGVLFSDFSVAPLYPIGQAEPAGGGWGSDWPLTTNTNTAFPLFDGNNYLYIEGAPWQSMNPYVDITEMPARTGDTLSSTFLPLYSNSDRVYVNMAVYNTGRQYTWLEVQFVEEDNAGGTIVRSWNIRPTWDGWKMIAVKYTDLISTDTNPFNPDRVKQINLILLSDQDVSAPTKETVSIALDQLVFTFDTPIGVVNY